MLRTKTVKLDNKECAMTTTWNTGLRIFFYSSSILPLVADGFYLNGLALDEALKHDNKNNTRPLIKGFVDLNVIRVNWSHIRLFSFSFLFSFVLKFRSDDSRQLLDFWNHTTLTYHQRSKHFGSARPNGARNVLTKEQTLHQKRNTLTHKLYWKWPRSKNAVASVVPL